MKSPLKKCPSGKFRYATLDAAHNQLAVIRARAADEIARKGFTRRREKAAYECPECGGAHLTSKPQPPVAPIAVVVAAHGDALAWDRAALDELDDA
jgi:rRNA maturation protein Nop10